MLMMMLLLWVSVVSVVGMLVIVVMKWGVLMVEVSVWLVVLVMGILLVE